MSVGMKKALVNMRQAVRDNITEDRREHCLIVSDTAIEAGKRGELLGVINCSEDILQNAKRWLKKDKYAKVKDAVDVVMKLALKASAKKKADAEAKEAADKEEDEEGNPVATTVPTADVMCAKPECKSNDAGKCKAKNADCPDIVKPEKKKGFLGLLGK